MYTHFIVGANYMYVFFCRCTNKILKGPVQITYIGAHMHDTGKLFFMQILFMYPTLHKNMG